MEAGQRSLPRAHWLRRLLSDAQALSIDGIKNIVCAVAHAADVQRIGPFRSTLDAQLCENRQRVGQGAQVVHGWRAPCIGESQRRMRKTNQEIRLQRALETQASVGQASGWNADSCTEEKSE